MTCESYFELLSARLDGELSPQEEGSLAEHLASCAQCRVLAEQLGQLHGAMAALDEPVPEELAGQVMARVQEEKARQRRTARRRLVRWAAGAAACLAVCVGTWQLTHMPSDDLSDGPDMSIQPMLEEPDPQSSNQPRIGPASYIPEPADSSLSPLPLSVPAVITFERLPEGWEELFPDVATPDTLEVSAEEAQAFLQLLIEQDITSAISGRLEENSTCQLLLAKG